MITTHAVVAPQAAGLEVDWLHNPADVEQVAAEWQILAAATGAEIFLTPEWFALWWQHFGQGRGFACLVARQNGELVGLLPFCLDRIWVGPLPLRVARLAGTDPHCMVMTLPVKEMFGLTVLELASRYLLETLGCAAVSFTPMSDRAKHRGWLKNLQGLTVTTVPEGTHAMFDLPSSFDAYLAGLSSNRRGQVRRDLRGLESNLAMTSSAIVPDATDFEEFIAFHNSQWQAAGKGGHFADWPGSAAFYTALCARSRADWGVRLDTQRDDQGRPLATHFQVIGGNISHARLPARTLDPDAEKWSLGKSGLVLMLKSLMDSGIFTVEAGRGVYEHKTWLGAVDVPVSRLLVSRQTVFARLKVKALLGWADGLNLLYYRIWFLKAAPVFRRKLGLKPRPLWRSWIRTRI